VVAALAAGVTLAAAAPAAADDIAVAQAYRADADKVRPLFPKGAKAFRRWVRSDGRRAVPILRILFRLRQIQRTRFEAVRAEEASTDTGARARTKLLRSLRLSARYARHTTRFVELASKAAAARRAGNAERSGRALGRAVPFYRRSRREVKASRRLGREGRRLMQEALELAPPAPPAPPPPA
jgi:hypothetical protein